MGCVTYASCNFFLLSTNNYPDIPPLPSLNTYVWSKLLFQPSLPLGLHVHLEDSLISSVVGDSVHVSVKYISGVIYSDVFNCAVAGAEIKPLGAQRQAIW